MRYLVPGVVTLLLAGCAAPPIAFVHVTGRFDLPRPDDLVQFPEQAIAIAQQTCAPKPSDSDTAKESWETLLRGDWRATLQNGNWHVTLNADNAMGCPDYYVDVRAGDGKAGDCMECLVVT